MPSPDELEFIRKYIERNPYTNSIMLDLPGLGNDPSLRALLRATWDAGYNAGFVDGDGDCTVEQANVNPYT